LYLFSNVKIKVWTGHTARTQGITTPPGCDVKKISNYNVNPLQLVPKRTMFKCPKMKDCLKNEQLAWQEVKSQGQIRNFEDNLLSKDIILQTSKQ